VAEEGGRHERIRHARIMPANASGAKRSGDLASAAGGRPAACVATVSRVNHGQARGEVPALAAVADRADALADTAELMGDDEGAQRLREQAADLRLRAMRLLDG
jgi:hypothetical protein